MSPVILVCSIAGCSDSVFECGGGIVLLSQLFTDFNTVNPRLSRRTDGDRSLHSGACFISCNPLYVSTPWLILLRCRPRSSRARCGSSMWRRDRSSPPPRRSAAPCASSLCSSPPHTNDVSAPCAASAATRSGPSELLVPLIHIYIIFFYHFLEWNINVVPLGR